MIDLGGVPVSLAEADGYADLHASHLLLVEQVLRIEEIHAVNAPWSGAGPGS
jgi:hypothetical protein